jgi:hypothetical protein
MKALVILAAVAAALPAWAQFASEPALSDLTVNDNVRVLTGRSPTVRLEWTTDPNRPIRDWDLMADNTGFYVIDATSATMPFWVQAGAPVNSLVFADSGDIGMGTASPAASVHVRRSNGTAQLLVQEVSAVTSQRTMLTLYNNGPVTMRFDNTATGGVDWDFGTINFSDFGIAGGAGQSFALTPAGNLTIAGTLTQSSDREAKEAVAALDPADVLERVAALPLARWSYRGDTARHVGPMAQDFAAAFGLGSGDTHVAVSDLAGVGLVAAQALHARAGALAAEVERLEQELRGREARFETLAAELAALETRRP